MLDVSKCTQGRCHVASSNTVRRIRRHSLLWAARTLRLPWLLFTPRIYHNAPSCCTDTASSEKHRGRTLFRGVDRTQGASQHRLCQPSNARRCRCQKNDLRWIRRPTRFAAHHTYRCTSHTTEATDRRACSGGRRIGISRQCQVIAGFYFSTSLGAISFVALARPCSAAEGSFLNPFVYRCLH